MQRSPRARRFRALRRHRRGVLEGLPLSILISIMIIAIGSTILLSIYFYAHATTLGSLTIATPRGTVSGFLPAASPTQLQVTAYAQSGGALGGVIVVLNGSGVSVSGVTAGNGSVFFWIVPVLHNHATSGVLSISASFSPGVSLAVQPNQRVTTTLVVLS